MLEVRRPAVAGRFYEGRREELEASIRECFEHPLGPGVLPQLLEDGPGEIEAVVSPHAGYMYSGPAAAHCFRALAEDGLPEVVIILGPSHHVAERRGAISTAAAWRTPLGDVAIEQELTRELLKTSTLLEVDERTHRDEHSIEVQVPFLQYVYSKRMPLIVAICIRAHVYAGETVAEDARKLGEQLASVVGERRAVVVASTDFSHHIPHDAAQRQDRYALDAIEKLDPEGLLEVVLARGITMCGATPVAVALSYCLARGAQQAKTLTYYTSGDVIGDKRGVVGYASVVIRRKGGGS